MKLGVLTTSWPQEGEPYAGLFVSALSEALSARGHEVRVVAVARAGDRALVPPGLRVTAVGAAPHPSLRVFYDGGAPEALRSRRAGVLLGAGYTLAALGASARRELRGVDALFSHFLLPSAALAELALRSVPQVAVAHGSDGALAARLPRTLRSALLRRCAALWCTHAAMARSLASELPAGTPLEVSPMGANAAPVLSPERRAQLRRELGASPSDTMGLCVGRLLELKGHAVLLEALALLPREVLWVFAGDGPERASLEARARSLGVRARFLGAVAPARRDELLAVADLFAHPALTLGDGSTEGAPTAVLEAMAVGLPVIASRAGGIEELLGDAGLLVPQRDPHALAAALEELLREANSGLELSRRARARAERFTWERVAARAEALLDAALERRATRG